MMHAVVSFGWRPVTSLNLRIVRTKWMRKGNIDASAKCREGQFHRQYLEPHRGYGYEYGLDANAAIPELELRRGAIGILEIPSAVRSETIDKEFAPSGGPRGCGWYRLVVAVVNGPRHVREGNSRRPDQSGQI